MPLPNITCQWSESSVFEDGRIYSVQEFDSIMKQADQEHSELHEQMLNKYGTYDKWQEAGEHMEVMGYYKVKFRSNLRSILRMAPALQNDRILGMETAE